MSWSGLTAALGILGLLLAGAARLAYESYFRTLGVTLDEVGLSNARMLTWGAVLVLAFVGWAGSSAFAGMVVLFDASQRLATRVPIGTIARIDRREPGDRC